MSWIWLAAAGIAGLTVAAGQPAVVLLLGEPWREAGTAMVAMVGFGLGTALQSASSETIKATGRTRLFHWTSACLLLLGVGLLVALLPLGLIGVGSRSPRPRSRRRALPVPRGPAHRCRRHRDTSRTTSPGSSRRESPPRPCGTWSATCCSPTPADLWFAVHSGGRGVFAAVCLTRSGSRPRTWPPRSCRRTEGATAGWLRLPRRRRAAPEVAGAVDQDAVPVSLPTSTRASAPCRWPPTERLATAPRRAHRSRPRQSGS